MLKPFKLIYSKDLEDKRIHNFRQAPNSSPIYQGWFINEEHARKNIDCYLNCDKISLIEHKNEICYLDLHFCDCETLTFTYLDVVCNLEDFQIHVVSNERLTVRGGITKNLFGENPYKLENYQYIKYGLVNID